MKQKQYNFLKVAFFLLMAIFLFHSSAFAQEEKKSEDGLRSESITTSPPDGYSRLGTTLLYYKRLDNSIDVWGKFGNSYYKSTFGNGGYKVAMKVGSNTAQFVSGDTSGSTINGVKCISNLVQQSDLARFCYDVTNNNISQVTISLGVYADVKIGDNDNAPITRKKDLAGNTYGLSMRDGYGAQMCALFGTGLTGVTGVTSFWFGYYTSNSSLSAIVGNYSAGSSYMVENGSYDSGMGWCWKNITIAPGATITFSWLLGVGDVNLQPASDFELTPQNLNSWNDLSVPHNFTVTGSYVSPAGQQGVIEYAVEDGTQWTSLTESMVSGSTFSETLVVNFDATRSEHTIKFRTRDTVGNTTVLKTFTWPDVAFHDATGITDMTYTGQALFQTSVTCDLDEGQYTLTNYQNNVNAGTASFNLEGVYPYTIGRKTYSFTIDPQPLSGGILLSGTAFVYNGQAFTPSWQFTNGAYANLLEGTDYDKVWSSNCLPGTATLTITGKNNYIGTLTAHFTIDKAPLTDGLFTLTLPEEDITYDGQSHGASITTAEGVGEAIITYQKRGEAEATTVAPSETGEYTIYLAFSDGSLYYGRDRKQVGTFTIYPFSVEEWAVLQAVHHQLIGMEWSKPWDMSQGISSVSTLHGLTIKKGHVIGVDLSEQNLTGEFPCSILALPQLKSINIANNHLSGDVGAAINDYAQEHPTLMGNVQEINISGNQLSGNIGLFANCFDSLTSLDASNNCLEVVSPVIPSSVTTLDISKQTISRVVPLHLANISVESFANMVPSILLYNHASQSFAQNYNLLCSTQSNNWSMTLAYMNGTLSIPYISESNAYYGENGGLLNVVVAHANSTNDGSTFLISLSFDEGDADFDGRVNVLDLQAVLNYTLENNHNRPFNFTASNLWKDEVIDAQDAASLANILLDSDNSSSTQPSDAPAIVTVDGGYLKILSTVPVSAFHITISTNYQAELLSTLTDMGFTCEIRQSGGVLYLVGYSNSGAEIPVGETAICKLNSGDITYVMLADHEANEIISSIHPGQPATEPYAVYENGTLSFYYDSQKDSRQGTVYTTFRSDVSDSWGSKVSNITTVTFDSSFDSYTELTSTAYWFRGMENLTTINGITHLKTINVTDMGKMFSKCKKLTSLDLSELNTAKVTNMNYMFSECSSLTSLNVSNFNTASVTNMHCMFQSCSNLLSLNLGNFITEKVTDMGWMFNYCSKIVTLDLSNFNTAKVTDMEAMFRFCSSLSSLNIGNFNTANVTKMGGMFYYCTMLDELNLTSFNTSKVTEMTRSSSGTYNGMFESCSKLATIRVSNLWTTNGVSQSEEMFLGCTSLVGGDGTVYDPNYTDKTKAYAGIGGYLTMEGQEVGTKEAYAVVSPEGTTLSFYYDNKMSSREGTVYTSSNFRTSLSNGWSGSASTITTVTFNSSFSSYTGLTSTAYWFYGMNNLNTINGLSNLKTNNVTIMSSMFDGSSSLTSLNLSGFNTANVKYMSSMFAGCSGLTSLDLSGFNTSSVLYMNYMFSRCSSLTSLDLSGFNTARVKGMSYMFWGCSSLSSLDISVFNTASVTSMEWMFCSCSSLTSLDLSGLNTANVTYMYKMFDGSSQLNTIQVSDLWNTDKVSYSKDMFNGCTNLVGGDGTVYNPNYTDKTKAYAGIGGYLTMEGQNDDDLQNYLDMLIMDTEDWWSGGSYHRQFYTDCWQTLYVPFTMSYSDWQDKFEVAQLTGIDQYDTNGDGVADYHELIASVVESGSTTQANYPYLIRAKTKNASVLTLNKQAGDENADSHVFICGNFQYIAHGNYGLQADMHGMGAYRLRGGAFSIPESDDEVLPPNRWYLTLDSRVQPCQVRVRIVDTEATTISDPVRQQDLVNKDVNYAIYDMQGRKVAAGSEATDRLRKGLYIINNKKRLVK